MKFFILHIVCLNAVIDLVYTLQLSFFPDFVNGTFLLEICTKFNEFFESELSVCPCDWSCKRCQTCNQREGACIPYELLLPAEQEIKISALDHCKSEASSSFILLCSQNVTASNFMDLFPVTSRVTNITYKNRYCSECNNDTNYSIWELSTNCTFDMNLMSSSEEVWNYAKKSKCSIRYEEPWSKVAEHCKPVFGADYISQCNISGKWVIYNPHIEWACENTLMPFGMFKNIFCHVCNSRNISMPSIRYDKGRFIHKIPDTGLSVELVNASCYDISTHKVSCFMRMKILNMCRVTYLEFHCSDHIDPFDIKSFGSFVRNAIQHCNTQYLVSDADSSEHRTTKKVPLINSCNVTGKWASYDSDIDFLCKQNFPETSLIVCNPLYSNMFCEICNGVYSPYHINFVNEIVGTYRHRFSIYELWISDGKINQGDGETKTCGNKNVWDPWEGQCRQLVCVPGKRVQGNTCLPLLRHSTKLGYTLAIELMVTKVVNGSNTSVILVIDHIKQHFDEVLNDLDVKILSMFMVFERPCSVALDEFDTENHLLKIFIKMITKANRLIDRQVLESNLFNLTKLPLEIKKNLYSIKFSSRTSEEGLLLPALYSSYDPSKFCKKRHGLNLPIPVLENENDRFSFLVNKLLFCLQIKLEENEFTSKGSQIYVPIVNRSFGPFEYFKSDKRVYQVCWNDYMSIKTEYFSMDKILAIFSFVCTILSMLGIILTLIAFSFLPNSRTLPVKLLILLLVALFLTQLSSVIADEATMKDHCLVLGALLHYFWLCVFACAMACSSQMYRVFSDSRPARNQQRKENRLFICYLSMSLFFPMLFIAGNFVYAYVYRSNIKDMYDRKGCTFNDKYGMLGFFILPISVILATNLTFFARTCCIIKSVPRVEGPNVQIKHSRIFHKLFLITCISWILQIVDGLFPISLFSFVVALVNGAQGMFIFVSYIWERKTLIFLLDKFSRSQNEDGTTTSKMF